MTTAEIFQGLKALLPSSILELTETKPDPSIKIDGGSIKEIATHLKERF